jgi:hypothetical protein
MEFAAFTRYDRGIVHSLKTRTGMISGGLDMGKLNVGILGAGGMGHVHGGNLAKIDDVQVVSVCDADLDKARKLAGPLGADAYADFDGMLRGKELDILYILLPPYARGGLSVRRRQQPRQQARV